MVRGKSKQTPRTEDVAEDEHEPVNKQARIVKKQPIELSLPNLPVESGNILSCGVGDFGQLGLGEDITERTRPALVDIVKTVVGICAGGMHTLCLTKDGDVYSFGCNDEGALGRDASDEGAEFIPAKVDLPGKALKISAGDSHSACLLADGKVYAWGSFRDSHGNMGLTLEGNKRLPIEVLPSIKSVDIASGTDHLVILTSNGKLYTVGCAEQGQLGRVSHRSASGESRRGKTELLRPGLVYTKAKNMMADKIWATRYCTFFHEKDTEHIYGFGLNNYNQLGLPKSGEPIFVPKLTNFEDVKEISGGQHHTLVLKNNGKCYVVGRKEYGRLGIGNVQNDVEELTLVKALEKFNIVSIGCGDHCSFAVTDKGEVYSWGIGSNQQLGLGSEDDQYLPQLLTGAQVKNKKVLHVSGGGQHTAFIVENKATINGNGNIQTERNPQISLVDVNTAESSKTTEDDEDIQSKEISTSTSPIKKGKKKKN